MSHILFIQMVKKDSSDSGNKKCPKKVNNKSSSAKDTGVFSFHKIKANKTFNVSFPMMYIQKNGRKGRKGQMQMAIPLFRNDGRFETPGFSLPDQFTEKNVQEHVQMHHARVMTETTEIDVSNILLPKPSLKNNYCTICKVRFEDYVEHISLEQHLTKMRQSPFNKDISEICQSYALKTEHRMKDDSQLSKIVQDESTEMLEFQRTMSKNKDQLYEEIREEYQKFVNFRKSSSVFNVINIMEC